jgi:hypothetical protein
MTVELKGNGGLINEDFKEDVDGFADRGFQDETIIGEVLTAYKLKGFWE